MFSARLSGLGLYDLNSKVNAANQQKTAKITNISQLSYTFATKASQIISTLLLVIHLKYP